MKSRRSPRRAAPVPAFVALAAVLVVLAGCDLGSASRASAATPTPLPSVTPLPTPLASATPGQQLPAFSGGLGAAPASCPASPPLQTYQATNFGGGFSQDIAFQGGPPVWELGLGPVVHLQRDPTTGYYDTKVMWVVGPNVSQPVTLTAPAVQGGTPLWFDVYPRNGATGNTQDIYGTSALLDPGAPNRGGTDNSTGHWNIWGIGMIALSAGCYDVTASWAGGSWHTIVAFGS